MDDPVLRQEMSEIGLRRVENELGWPHQQCRLLEAYERILGDPASAPEVVA
jgi:hypothetical protein